MESSATRATRQWRAVKNKNVRNHMSVLNHWCAIQTYSKNNNITTTTAATEQQHHTLLRQTSIAATRQRIPRRWQWSSGHAGKERCLLLEMLVCQCLQCRRGVIDARRYYQVAIGIGDAPIRAAVVLDTPPQTQKERNKKHTDQFSIVLRSNSAVPS